MIRIPNIETYTQEIINGVMILTPKEMNITEEEIYKTNLAHSTILDCVVKNGNNVITNNTKYISILRDIWISMPTQKILQTTAFNMKLTNENNANGYIWCSKLNMSIQYKDATNTFIEIINMLKVNNYTIVIRIKLQSNKIIRFVIE